LRELGIPDDPRLLTGRGDNEDAAVVSLPPGKVLVQTVDFFTPVVNDPFRFGQIAAANALSDVYAMGAEPLTAMNIVCFPSGRMSLDILRDILAGGLSKVRESGAVMAGGHSVSDAEVKYGLSVSGLADPGKFATNRGLRPGDCLLLTKPLGTGVLATAVKAAMPGFEDMEETIWQVASRLNSVPGAVIREFGLKAATDVTGFGFGGHALEMSKASAWAIEVRAENVPVLPRALDLARQGFVPGGSHANRRYFDSLTRVAPGVDPARLDLLFDAQTSGGMLLAVSQDLIQLVRARLEAAGELAAEVGRVLDMPAPEGLLIIS
jgi:selenide,water dikinase